MTSKILVVEDDPEYQDLLKVLLASFDLTVCSSSEDAKSRLDSGRFDLVLCDINLLGVSGFELLSHIKDNELNKQTPFVFCSSQMDADTKQRASAMGAAGFIPKPYDTDVLLSVVQTFLK